MSEKKAVNYRIVTLNEVIGEEGEFKPGYGVRVKNGKLVAIQPGILVIDKENNVLNVTPIAAGG